MREGAPWVEMGNSRKPTWKCPEADGPSGPPGEWLCTTASELGVTGVKWGEYQYV